MRYFQNVNSFYAIFSKYMESLFMTLKERIKELCKQKKIAVSKLEDDLGFAGGYISKLDKSTPNTDKINAIANYLDVSLDYLIGNTHETRCKICNCSYDPLFQEDLESHEYFHNKFLSLKEKFPFFMTYPVADNQRMDSISIFRDPQSSIEEKIEAFDKYLQATFSMEVASLGYDIEQLNYAQFCKTEVSTLKVDWAISEELIEKLADKYGVDRNFLNGNEQILARVSNNPQLMRILAYAEKLNPGMLDALEVQVKAWTDNNTKG